MVLLKNHNPPEFWVQNVAIYNGKRILKDVGFFNFDICCCWDVFVHIIVVYINIWLKHACPLNFFWGLADRAEERRDKEVQALTVSWRDKDCEASSILLFGTDCLVLKSTYIAWTICWKVNHCFLSCHGEPFRLLCIHPVSQDIYKSAINSCCFNEQKHHCSG